MSYRITRKNNARVSGDVGITQDRFRIGQISILSMEQAHGLKMNGLPILYTFRRCPYAMRARMGLAYAGIDFQIREVDLKNKPKEMLEVSPKGTVPVLLFEDSSVLEESLDILLWSLSLRDPDGWKNHPVEVLSQMAELVTENDDVFKKHLDQYKYSDRFPAETKHTYRQRGEAFLEKLESRLTGSIFLFGANISYADVAIFSFIRQFSHVEPAWFQTAPYPCLRKWLAYFVDSDLYDSIMKKYQPWQVNDPVISFQPAYI